MMATTTLPLRMTATALAERILAGPPTTDKLGIVDVRDDDYIGGHIKGSVNFPSNRLDVLLPTLVRRLADADTVVFHCALSQQRGPSAAVQYIRALESRGRHASGGAVRRQQVYVLDRGFVGWQEKYGEDERLTEGYSKELWQNGY